MQQYERSEAGIMSLLPLHLVCRHESQPPVEKAVRVGQQREQPSQLVNCVLRLSRLPAKTVVLPCRTCGHHPELNQYLRREADLISLQEETLHCLLAWLVGGVFAIHKPQHDVCVEKVVGHQ